MTEKEILSKQIADAQKIEKFCRTYNLCNRNDNSKLYQELKRNEAMFETWVGKVFLEGLRKRTQEGKRKKILVKCCWLGAKSFFLLALFLLGVMIYSGVEQAKQEAVLDYIRQERLAVSTRNAESELSDSEITLENDSGVSDGILEEYQSLYSMNKELVGWLKVQGTNIDYPVMQSCNKEDFYLDHDFQKNESVRGALFISGEAQISPMDQNLVIFGHNMRDGSMFGELKKYLDKSYWEQNPQIEFDTIYKKGTYRIVSVVRTSVLEEHEEGFRYYWFRNYNNRDEFQQLKDFLEEKQVYKTGETVEYSDTLLMLSTCEYSTDQGRLVVIAKKIQADY